MSLMFNCGATAPGELDLGFTYSIITQVSFNTTQHCQYIDSTMQAGFVHHRLPLTVARCNIEFPDESAGSLVGCEVAY